MKNILVGQSGGPTSVINASLYGVIKESLDNDIEKIYGMVNGIEGFLEDKCIELQNLSEEKLKLLKITPSAFLGSCRFKLPSDYNDDIYKRIFKKLSEKNIGYVVYIGGNDSMDTVNKLAHYADMVMSKVKFIGVPKTIDNDLVCTDHTPGFGSAAKFIATAVRDITYDAEVYDKKSVTIVEIMGRHAGWLTAASIMAREEKEDNPVLVYLPEIEFDVFEFVQNVKEALTKKNNVVVCVSEGIKDKTGKFICEYINEAKLDVFGHKSLTGCGKYLENEIKEKLGVKVRSIELNVLQRASSLTLSETDVEESENVGREAVKAILDGETHVMVAIVRDEDYNISYDTVNVLKVCNKERTFPIEWIINKNDISDDFIQYISPIIKGNVEVSRDELGMPKYIKAVKS
ncbi:MAG: 6-phosphofructokinase [Clostridiales bacterium]|nr:6-phosphofructokinase [Clostridiales bacterium]